MIKRTFSHLPGISEITEQKLWGEGISSWEHLYDECIHIFSPKRSRIILLALEKSLNQLERGNLFHFYNLFPRQHLWRLIPGYESKVAFIDIETTGLSFPPHNMVTTVSMLLNGTLYQAHEPRAKRRLLSRMKDEASILVSYNGEVFDVPFLRRQFKTRIDLPHVDLRFALRRHGYTGGLKRVEKTAKVKFKRRLKGIDGYDAVVLWEIYKSGNRRALNTLLAYNAEDTLVLQPLTEKLLKLESDLIGVDISERFKKVLPRCKYRECKKVLRNVMKRRDEDYYLWR